VQLHTGGKFSGRFLTSLGSGAAILAYRIEPAPHLDELATSTGRPLVLFCTGSGIAPVRSLLQHRIARLRAAGASLPAVSAAAVAAAAEGAPGGPIPRPQEQGERSAAGHQAGKPETAEHASIMLLVGQKPADTAQVHEAVAEARALGLLDVMRLVPSSAARRRAQDVLFDEEEEEGDGGGVRQRVLDRAFGSCYSRGCGAMVFACARPDAEDFRGNLGALLGVADVRDVLGGRYVADVFQAAS
jgi:hypothetical protein